MGISGTTTSAGETRSVIGYESQLRVANLAADRRSDGVTITVFADWRRIAGAFGMFAGILATAAMVGFLTYDSRMSRRSLTALDFIAPGCVVLVGLYYLAAHLVFILTPSKWEADPHDLRFTARTLLAVRKEAWPRRQIADLRVERVRVKNRSFKRLYMVMQTDTGQIVALAKHSRPALEFLCSTLREALRLPPDPSGTAEYPPAPRWCRPKRTILANAIVMRIPPPMPIVPGVLFAIAGFVLMLSLDNFLFGSGGYHWMPRSSAYLPYLRSGLFAFLATIASCAMLLKVRQSVAIAIDRTKLTFAQTGLRHPCHIEVPLEQVIEIRAFAPPGRRRMNLEIVLEKEDPIRIRARLLKRDAEWLVASLDVARRRAHRIHMTV